MKGDSIVISPSLRHLGEFWSTEGQQSPSQDHFDSPSV